eukprot:4216141-Karenia_brevis.AAC.1
MSGPGSEVTVPDSPVDDVWREDSRVLNYESFDSESQYEVSMVAEPGSSSVGALPRVDEQSGSR